ncbi:MAG: ribonuclease HII [Acidobacteria bacterium]|nr:ribonuclease HII [Acidobacteriota bacterium]
MGRYCCHEGLVGVKTMRKSLRTSSPGLSAERAAWSSGHVVAGMDEVGKGAWAGPLTLAAVVAPRDRRIYKVRDSKMLTSAERETAFDRITSWCDAYSVGHATHRECDELGMSDAQRLAAQRCLAGLGSEPTRILIDGNWDFLGDGRAETIVGGDASSLTIAAASIVAKVSRDRIMRHAARWYPGYDFERNKGYPCPRHQSVLQAWGPTAFHRRSWAFMDSLVWSNPPRHRRDAQATLF